MTNILFITWDGPQTSYIEGLFMPIFEAMQQQRPDYVFHVVQFTWAAEERIAVTERAATKHKIHYTAFSIWRNPSVMLGSLMTIIRGVRFLSNYCNRHNIKVLMPRSTFPAIMVNRLKLARKKILFDADGLPIEERVDFAGLSKTSFLYRFLKAEERKMLIQANAVITRSNKAIAYHISQLGDIDTTKFSLVFNGRDSNVFQPKTEERVAFRKDLGLADSDILFVYCGSLGPQYGWHAMLRIFSAFREKHLSAKFLVLTGSTDYAYNHTPKQMLPYLIVKSVPFSKVPSYLNAADIAFAIRDPKPSMIGVAPIKLGEYLLMGLPTIASKGIGDSEFILSGLTGTLLVDGELEKSMRDILFFLEKLKTFDRNKIRQRGLIYSSLESAVSSYFSALNKI